MEKLVSLCKRRGFMFQSSEIYGGLNGFWDYGPLGVELNDTVAHPPPYATGATTNNTATASSTRRIAPSFASNTALTPPPPLRFPASRGQTP